jgi:branched-chain amino acid transport system ATP-binding protein
MCRRSDRWADLMAEPRVVLQTTGLARRFGGLRAVDSVDLRVREGRIHCIIGPNGAGKSTLFNLISGVLPPTAGRIAFEEREITRKSPQAIARLGLARSFQTPRVFASMSVLDHVLLASREHPHHCPLARDALTRVGLHERAQVLGESLAHGEKKRLELAMTLAMRPRLVLLDEPTAGMNAHETDAVATIVREIAAVATVAIIEHDIDFVRGLADDVTVLHKGSVLREGTIAEIEGDDVVRRVYLGEV